MLVAGFNIVITTPFTAVLMLSTYGFLQQHSYISLHYLVGSAVTNAKYITPLVKVLKIPLTDCDLESHIMSRK